MWLLEAMICSAIEPGPLEEEPLILTVEFLSNPCLANFKFSFLHYSYIFRCEWFFISEPHSSLFYVEKFRIYDNEHLDRQLIFMYIDFILITGL